MSLFGPLVYFITDIITSLFLMCGGKNVDGKRAESETDSEVSGMHSSQMKSMFVAISPLPRRVPTRKFLDAILSNKELCQALEAFLQAEFCIENLLFLKRTGEYRELCQKSKMDSEEDRIKMGEFRDLIQKEFMLPSSEKEVIFTK
jgi:hypothetical protein